MHVIQKKSLNSNLIIKILLFILVFTIISIAFYSFSSKSIKDNFEEMLNQGISRELTNIDNFFRYPENVINILSQNENIVTYTMENRITKINILSLFESIIVTDSRIENIYYVLNNGEVVSYISPKNIDIKLTQTTWFKKAVEGKTRFVWITHKSTFLGEEVISCLMQVLDKYGRPTGIIGVDIKLSQLSELVRGANIGKNGVSMIVDMDNKIVAHTDADSVGKYIGISQREISQESFNGKSLTIKVNNKKFKCKISQVKKLPWKWNIVSAIPVNEITYSIIRSVFLFIAFSVVGFTMAFIMYLKNKATRNYLSIAEELAISNERNRMARDFHDTMGQTLSILMTLLQVSILSCREDSTKTESNLKKAIRIAKEGVEEFRKTILSDTSSQKWEGNYLFDKLQKLVREYEDIGISVDLSVNKIDSKIDVEHSKTIYRICQESLTNSLKHGNATEVSIIIKFSEKDIKIFTFDNGVGCKNMASENGFGLKAMKQRIDNLKGTLKYGSDGENGFNIHVELPIDR